MEDAAVGLDGLWEELRSHPTSFDFFQAVRILERLWPERGRVGGFGDPAEEVVRFSTHQSLAFPASEIQELEGGDGGPVQMSVNFMGLTGPQGVLPYQYSLLVIERAKARDPALGEFLDLFHHRFISLFYRAWKKHHFVAGEETGDGRLRRHLLDLIGAGLESFRSSLPLDEDALISYAGLLAPQQRSAAALEQLLEDYFQVPVQVVQFVGGWYSLPRDDQCAIGEVDCASIQLGGGAVVGDAIWDQQTRVRIRIGPLSRPQYDRFLPRGDAHDALRELTRLFGNDQFEFEVQLVLASDEVTGCVLGAEEHSPQPLGWSTWIRSKAFTRDADETILQLERRLGR